MPDGEPTLQIGEVARDAAFNHRQGDNPENDRGDCGIVCCADVLSQFGVRRTEAEVVWHATECGEFHVAAGDPDSSGGTLPAEVARILSDYGVPAHAWHGKSTGRLAVAVQRGHGVIVAVNAGILWGNPREVGARNLVTLGNWPRHPQRSRRRAADRGVPGQACIQLLRAPGRRVYGGTMRAVCPLNASRQLTLEAACRNHRFPRPRWPCCASPIRRSSPPCGGTASR